MTMQKSVIVYGPQGCGKTRNARALATYFKLQHWRDWEPGEAMPKMNHLILTSEDPRTLPRTIAMLRAFSFDTAMTMAGLKK